MRLSDAEPHYLTTGTGHSVDASTYTAYVLRVLRQFPIVRPTWGVSLGNR